MEMKIRTQHLKTLREARAWSQEHLASAAGLSLRTIQRIESEGRASSESVLALAAALDIPVSDIVEPPSPLNAPSPTAAQPASAFSPLKEFSLKKQFLRYFVIFGLMCLFDLIQHHGTWTWSKWPLIFWGIALAIKALRIKLTHSTHPPSISP